MNMGISILFIWISVMYSNEEHKTKILEKNISDLRTIIDSLNYEVLKSQSDVIRYELSLDHLKETHPKTAAEFTDYFNNDTE